MKKLGILLLFALLFISCEKDNGVIPEDLKKEVTKELKGKVFTAYEAQVYKEGSGNTEVDPQKAFFTKMEIVGEVIELTSANNMKSRYGFDINNANRNSEELPEVLSLAMKSSYKNFYIYLSKDYSNAVVTLTHGSSSYGISMKP